MTEDTSHHHPEPTGQTPPLSIDQLTAGWERVRDRLRTDLGDNAWRHWIKNLQFIEKAGASIILGAESKLATSRVSGQYTDRLRANFKLEWPEVDNVEIRHVHRTATMPPKPARASGQPASSVRARAMDDFEDFGGRLDPRMTFDNFVVEKPNEFAHAVALKTAMSENPQFNPLFLYGGVGLGKTHLMHAVAHQMLNNNPSAHIAYVSTEKFTNEFIRAIQENKLSKFRKYYRNVDALLVDDIHFLSGKESTQEEFFHTFNDLFESGRQIFLASDRPANEIERLENRLVSRFQWGLVTDIQAPDFETRVAIFRKKAAARGIELEDPVFEFLAERVCRNVRRMEGALTRIASYNSLIDQQLDLESVERLLSDLFLEEAASKITVEQIQNKVSDYYQIRFAEMVGRRRTSTIVVPRQVAMYISRTLTSDPLKSIGEAFGGRDHGTVIHACKQVENMMEQDCSVKRAVDYLIHQLSHNRS